MLAFSVGRNDPVYVTRTLRSILAVPCADIVKARRMTERARWSAILFSPVPPPALIRLLITPRGLSPTC
jgi:hypothetical protein